MPDLDFAGLNARLLSDARNLLPSWLPGGRIQGHEYVCGSLQGGKGESFSVNLNTGRWAEFSGSERGGDLVSLYAAIHGIGQGEAFKRLEGDRAPLALPAAVPVAPEVYTPPPAGAPAPDLSDAEASWCYRDATGAPLFYVARFPGKRIRPFSWDGTGWVQRSVPRPRPLYGLELLAERPGDSVLIVEGEKACMAARKLAGHVYVCVTWPNGASSYGAADWAPLHGRKVLIWPDADEPGLKAAQAIADALGPHCPEVKVLYGLTQDVLDANDGTLPVGWDAADALREGWTWASVVAWAKPRARVWETPAQVQVLTPEPLNPLSPLDPVPTARLEVSMVDDSAPLSRSMADFYTIHNLDMNHQGRLETTADNITRVLSRVPAFQGLVYYDEFYDAIFHPNGREWTDADTCKLLVRLQRELQFRRISKQTLLDGLLVYAHENARNAPKDWMDGLVWDGTPRLGGFLPTYTGSEDSDYTRAAGRNWWISMVARIYQPGCKVDTMLILKGEQGRFKSTLFSVIGGPWYAVATADVDDPKAFGETLRGKMVMELAELVAFGKAEENSIKRLITTQSDRYRNSYGHFAEDHPRRCVLVGTTNKGAFLGDETGARRFWPVHITMCNIEALRRDRDQLFAEAVHAFKAGATWWEMPASTLDAQEGVREHDELETKVEAFIRIRPEGVTLHDIWVDGLGFPFKDCKRAEQNRLAKILRTMRWEKGSKAVRRNGDVVWLWQPLDPPF